MWTWATSSDRVASGYAPPGRDRRAQSRRGPIRPPAWARSLPALAAPPSLLLALLLPHAGAAQTFLTQQEALRLAFPEPATIERRTAFLNEKDLDRARHRAGPEVPVHQRIVTYYVGRREDCTLGFAYFDAHRVRTLQEVLMVVVTPEATVDRVEVLQFHEPREYLSREKWLEQFTGSGLDGRAGSKGGIINLTGATLTSRAVERAVRRVLALHEVIQGGGQQPTGTETRKPSGGRTRAATGGGER